MSKLVLQSADPAPGSREWLERKTEFVLTLAYRQACDVVRIGAALEEVKRAVGHGGYQRWVEERLPFSVQHAHKCRQVARAFAAYQTSQFEMFEPSALYVLAQPKGVRPEVRAHAVQLAEAGERITHARALELIDAHRPVQLTDRDVSRYERDRRKLDAVRVVQTVGRGRHERQEVTRIDPDSATARQQAHEDAAHARIGKLFVEALRQFTTLTLEHLPNEAKKEVEDDPDLMFCVTGYARDEAVGTRVRSQSDPRLLLESLLGIESRKFCAGCCRNPLETVPLADFCKNADQPDGRNPRCRKCERARKAVLRDKKRKQQEEGE